MCSTHCVPLFYCSTYSGVFTTQKRTNLVYFFPHFLIRFMQSMQSYTIIKAPHPNKNIQTFG